jgi:phospholipase C
MSLSVDAAPLRRAGSLPFPGRAPGSVDQTMPFDHIVVVMMENHSFDNLLGALPLSNPAVDGLSFLHGRPVNPPNPGAGHTPAEVQPFPLSTTAQAKNITQSWKATHEQIAGGAMNGFVRSSGTVEPMGYYTPEVLPFAYSLASTFTLANRWFCSVPGPTYPNRRFLLAGTAFGGTVTSVESLFDSPPPNGTIFDRLCEQNISWRDYFTDMSMTSVIPSIILKHPSHHHPISRFFHDCQAGTLPAVSFVDPGVGVVSSIASTLVSLPFPVGEILKVIGADLSGAPGETEEDPQNMYYGEAWAHSVVEAVLQSPRWDRTLLIYTYDEHGGYYDHVAPPAALPPDDIPPSLQPDDPRGGYDMYGVRVPAIVVSAHSKLGGVSDLTYDHTSILATIERKWNLPALSYRDANAHPMTDYFDFVRPAFAEPPKLAAPPAMKPGLELCKQAGLQPPAGTPGLSSVFG